jgi:hypothetical protein
MATPYTGDETATQAPSPPPGPDVAPIVVLPDDGDADNAASVAQAFKVLADFIAWLMAPLAVVAAWAQTIFWWSDARGNKRFVIDHFGFPAGALDARTEMWQPAAGFAVSGAGPTTNGSWTWTSNASGSGSVVNAPGIVVGANFSSLSPCLQINVDGTGSGKTGSWGEAATSIFVDESIVELEFDAEAYTVSGIQWDMGFAANGAPGSISKGVYFSRPVGAGVNWQCITVDGGSPTTVDSGILATGGTHHQFRIIVVGASISDDSTARALFYIDGALVANITSTLPVNNGSLMGPSFGGQTSGSPGGTQTLLVGAKVSRQNTRLATI